MAIEPSHKVSSQATPLIISELWNQAYDDLKAKEENLARDYEATLSTNLVTVGSSEVLSGLKMERKKQMETLLKRKIEEVNQDSWKLRFGGEEIPVKDLVEPVVGVIDWANEYISDAVSVNPYASIAWAGVGLLLPVSNTVPNPCTCQYILLSSLMYSK